MSLFYNPPVTLFTPQKERQRRMNTAAPHHRAGFTLVEIMIVVAIIGLLAAIAIPNFVNSRAKSQATACINNLRQIDSAVQQFCMESGKKAGDTLNFPADVSAFVKMNTGGQIPGCPASGTYTLTVVGTIPSVLCSISSTVNPAHILP
jgi:prepilin-type N-terminal cleavage/methylation domain-containing protein